ncbi:MAG: hypothetical protein J6P74_08405 [Paludibacteraceae bacterium]|nr:hypothetical protein [Paludibacteraceae bacterium]
MALPKMYRTFSEAGTSSVSPCLTRMPLMFASPQRQTTTTNESVRRSTSAATCTTTRLTVG